MKNLGQVAVVVAALVVAGAASAQMGGGGMGGGGSTGNGGAMTMGGGMMGGVFPLVAPDGTVLVNRHPAGATPGSGTGMEVVAVSPNGTEVWHWTATSGVREAVVAGSLVVVASGQGSGGGMTGGNGSATASTSLTALQLSSGAVAWTAAVDGVAMNLTTATDRVYVLVSKMTTGGSGGGMCGGTGGSTGSGTGTRDLVAYGLDGHVLWTFPVVR